LLLFALLARFIWRALNVRPSDDDLSPFERRAARAVHGSFYALLLALMLSGYLISTPDGRPIDVFGWFSVPSVVQMHGLEDQAGRVHRWIAYAVIALAILHTLAALKHVLIDKDGVMRRMWSGPPSSSRNSERESRQ
jgi:cytochrome b561